MRHSGGYRVSRGTAKTAKQCWRNNDRRTKRLRLKRPGRYRVQGKGPVSRCSSSREIIGAVYKLSSPRGAGGVCVEFWPEGLFYILDTLYGLFRIETRRILDIQTENYVQ